MWVFFNDEAFKLKTYSTQAESGWWPAFLFGYLDLDSSKKVWLRGSATVGWMDAMTRGVASCWLLLKIADRSCRACTFFKPRSTAFLEYASVPRQFYSNSLVLVHPVEGVRLEWKREERGGMYGCAIFFEEVAQTVPQMIEWE